jgi:L-malate glycosyltransferase
MTLRSLRVLYVADCLFESAGGGTERQFLATYDRLPSIDVEAHVAFLFDDPVYRRIAWRNPPTVLRASFRDASMLTAPARLKRLARDVGADIVHTYYDRSAWIAASFCRIGRRIPLITSLRNMGYHHGAIRRMLMSVAYRSSDRVITNARAVREVLASRYCVPAEAIRVVPNIVEAAPALSGAPQEDLRRIKARFKHLVVAVANLRDVKGIPDLIAAAACLPRGADIGVLLVGEGPMREQYERQAAAMGVGERIVFFGRTDDVQSCLACADVAVLPSRSEGQSNALIEYALAELPIVATGVGGNAEILGEGERGILVPAQDPHALADAIAWLIEHPSDADAYAERAASYAKSAFSAQHSLGALRAVYDEILAPATRGR